MCCVWYIYFVGIGGVGMGGIVEVLVNEGYQISGFDLVLNLVIQQLLQFGVIIYFNYCLENVCDVSVVVVFSVILVDNLEIVVVYEVCILVICCVEMLVEFMCFCYGIVIVGIYGKIIIIVMVFSIYVEVGLDLIFVNGGLVKVVGVYVCFGYSCYLIVEVDESDVLFLYLQLMVVIVINIEVDYMDIYYGDFENLKQIFINFLYNLLFYGCVVMCVDDLVIWELLLCVGWQIIIYGFSDDVDVCVEDYCQVGVQGYFCLVCQDKVILQVMFNVLGCYNVLNVVVVVVVVMEEGIDDWVILCVLESFQGIGCCFDFFGEFLLVEVNGKLGSVMLIDDYGYYLMEVDVIIKVVCVGWLDKNLVMVFQLYCYICICDLYDDFVNVLIQVDVLLMLDVYLVGEVLILGVDSCLLCCIICGCGKVDLILVFDLVQVVEMLVLVLIGNDLVLVQGVGNIGKIVCYLVEIKLIL